MMPKHKIIYENGVYLPVVHPQKVVLCLLSACETHLQQKIGYWESFFNEKKCTFANPIFNKSK